MAHISIHNGLYDIEGDVEYTNSLAFFATPVDIYIKMDQGILAHEVCWFEQKGVHLSFHDWQGNEKLLTQNGWFYIGGQWDNSYYTKVCGKEAIINPAMLESSLNVAVNRYKRTRKMIYSC